MFPHGCEHLVCSKWGPVLCGHRTVSRYYSTKQPRPFTRYRSFSHDAAGEVPSRTFSIFLSIFDLSPSFLERFAFPVTKPTTLLSTSTITSHHDTPLTEVMKPILLYSIGLLAVRVSGASLSNKDFMLQDPDQAMIKFPYKVESLVSQVCCPPPVF